jgi:hypothetical protein
MSLFATAIGALAPFLPRPKAVILTWQCQKCGWMNDNNNGPCRKCGAPQAQADSEIERLRCENERLTRSHARLVDHIETLEREILLEQHICRHWKEEAARLARQSREERERREAQAQQALQQQSQNPLPTPRWAEMNGRSAMAYAQAQQNLGNQQAQLAQYAGQAQGLQGAFDGFCNCVPSRAQVWGARREG